MRRVLASAGVVLLVAGAGAAWYVHDQLATHDVRGSSTDEFVATDPIPGDSTIATTPGASTGSTTTGGSTAPVVPAGVAWPMYGYDAQRTHLAPGYAVHPPFRTRWSVRTSLVEFPPVVAYGRVFYAQQHGSLIARDAATGVIVWAREFHHCSAASPVVVAGVIYHAFMGPRCNKDRNARGMIVAVDAMTGKTLWTVTTPIVESSLVHVNGLLYYGAWDSRVYALSTVTHRVAWSRRVDSAITDSVAYHAGRVFIGTDRGGFYGLNAANGRVVWQTSSFSRFGAREYFYATPTVAYGRVYAANTDGYVYSFGERDGRLIWAKHVGSYVYSAPAVFQRRIYVGTFSGQLVALDAATGDILWHFNASSAIAGAPSIVDGVIYFSTLPGEHRGAQRPIKAGPARSYGVDLATHRAIWQSSTGRYSPVVADATSIYFVGAYRLSALEPGP